VALFTGIIEEIGSVREIKFISEGAILAVAARAVLSDLKIGDSIAVNGVCLTSTRIDTDAFVCDVSAETLQRSNLRLMKTGAKVNLERALPAGGRLGGHFVLGHVDGVSRLVAKTPSGSGYNVSFNFPRELERYLVYKGSVSVNGISLTIASLEQTTFSVAVIPHTLESTNLHSMMPGDSANLEVDILGKYFERFFQLGLAPPHNGPRITSEYLKSQGF